MSSLILSKYMNKKPINRRLNTVSDGEDETRCHVSSLLLSKYMNKKPIEVACSLNICLSKLEVLGLCLSKLEVLGYSSEYMDNV